jgi:hypothetical protein
MEVRLFPHSSRPGVGLPPRRESQRPLLPQHARQCPVLEAGSDLGFMVYPPLTANEAYRIGYEGEGHYRFTLYMGAVGDDWQQVFSALIAVPQGDSGVTTEEVEFHVAKPPMSYDAARKMVSMFIVPEDLDLPPGAIALRGSTNFQTPAGWDTVYSPVFNNIERPIAPMLLVRVETDWFPHQTTFRYVLQPGEAIHGSHMLPLGQVFFVPREELTLRDATPEEHEAFRRAKTEFFREKAALTLTTPYGLQYSPHYARKSRREPKP